MPDIGSLRLWHRPIWKAELFYMAVKGVAEAVQTALLLSAYYSYLKSRDYSPANRLPANAFVGLQEWSGEQWGAWRDADGKDFDAYLGQKV